MAISAIDSRQSSRLGLQSFSKGPQQDINFNLRNAIPDYGIIDINLSQKVPEILLSIGIEIFYRFLNSQNPPELQLFFEQWAAHVGRVVQFTRPVVVEDLGKHARVPVEEVLVEHRVVVGEGLCQPGQSRGRNLLEGGLVSLKADPTDVQNHAIVTIDDCPAWLVHGPLREYPQPGGRLIHNEWAGGLFSCRVAGSAVVATNTYPADGTTDVKTLRQTVGEACPSS
ncbi:uncharacterized protein CEXT_307931 [Caerostris extrusa]|uniref:Uncharacterized protein n=1 Tax=Caerostris extrusa TaxID=172846 RepID=A0AAV4VVS6_CAEEX|nr:uncharacterized protein CEXT_307931 [Caerostris extrusa]